MASVTELFIKDAQRDIEADLPGRARSLLASLRRVLGPDMDEQIEQRVSELERQTLPPVTSGPANQDDQTVGSTDDPSQADGGGASGDGADQPGNGNGAGLTFIDDPAQAIDGDPQNGATPEDAPAAGTEPTEDSSIASPEESDAELHSSESDPAMLPSEGDDTSESGNLKGDGGASDGDHEVIQK